MLWNWHESIHTRYCEAWKAKHLRLARNRLSLMLSNAATMLAIFNAIKSEFLEVVKSKITITQSIPTFWMLLACCNASIIEGIETSLGWTQKQKKMKVLTISKIQLFTALDSIADAWEGVWEAFWKSKNFKALTWKKKSKFCWIAKFSRKGILCSEIG